jgi:hypothetical protein
VKPGEDRKAESREAMKRLRAERVSVVQAATERNQQRRAARRKIRGQLAKGPQTVPELAATCDLPTSEVLWHIAGMRKYGDLIEDAQDRDYFKYRLLSAASATGGGAEDEGE